MLRARDRADGTMYEVVARFTTLLAAAQALPPGAGGSGVVAAAVAAMGRSLVLRIDTHMVVSNRTG